MRTAAWKMADIVVTGLIALVLGVLFFWWVGAVVFLLGLALVLRPKSPAVKAAWQRMTPEEEKASQRSLQEWTDWEATHGPNASGLANPSRQD